MWSEVSTFLVLLFLAFGWEVLSDVFLAVFSTARKITYSIKKHFRRRQWLDSGSTSSPILQHIVRQHRLVIQEVPKDGNCMFHALSDQLANYGANYSHQELRAIAVEYLRQNPIIDNTPIEHFLVRESLEDYLRRMSRDGEWGDQLVLQALSENLKRNILVYSDTDLHPTMVTFTTMVQTLTLGYVDGNHYISLRRESTRRAGIVNTEEGDSLVEESSDEDGYIKVLKQPGGFTAVVQAGEVIINGDQEHSEADQINTTRNGFQSHVKVTGDEGRSSLNVTTVVPGCKCEVREEEINGHKLEDRVTDVVVTMKVILASIAGIAGIEEDLIKTLNKPETVAKIVSIIQEQTMTIDYEGATTGCILLFFKPKSWEDVESFSDSFRRGKLGGLLAFILECAGIDWMKLSIGGSLGENKIILGLECQKNRRKSSKVLMKKSSPQPGGIELKFRLSKEARLLDRKEIEEVLRGAAAVAIDTASSIVKNGSNSTDSQKGCSLSEVEFHEVTPSITPVPLETKQFGSNELERKWPDKLKKHIFSFGSLLLRKLPKAVKQRNPLHHSIVDLFMRQHVCLLMVDKRKLGTALLVGGNHVLTCYHVIQSAVTEQQQKDPFKLNLFHAKKIVSTHVVVCFACGELDTIVMRMVQPHKVTSVPKICIGELKPDQCFYLAGHPFGNRRQRFESTLCLSSADTSMAYSNNCHIFFKSAFQPGSSGSSCVVIRDQRVVVCSVLIGELYAKEKPREKAVKIGIKLMSVYERLESEDAELASKLFAL